MSDVIKITGTITRIEPEQQLTEKLRKQNVVITTDGTYPEVLAAEFINDKIDLVQGFSEGQIVSISINIRGREHNGRVYVNLSGWKIESAGGAQAAPAAAPRQNNNASLRATPPKGAADDDNDLPF